ncbi:MAG TPA: cytochrome b N-terminal domain-containing protein [Chloroflexota bacterium]|nr:cytochrome b N-terminal domain-containing protein [Chloroflexota bacterium]
MRFVRAGSLGEWLEERAGTTTLGRTLFLRNVPLGVGLLYTLGFAALFVFTLQLVTGVVLALYYAPTPDHAYESVSYINDRVAFGRLVRGLHHWGSSAMVVLVGAHLVVVFTLAAYKRPREVTWLLGVGLLALTLAFSFTGYLLPWDEKAYWATSVGTNMAGTIPLIGDFVLRLARGGTELGAAALTRFYALHTLLLPGALISLLVGHVALVIWHGVSVPPTLWNAEQAAAERLREEEATRGYRPDAARYAFFKQAGRPFWPDIIVEDLTIAVVVFLVLLGLAMVFGAPLEAPADPTNTAYIPRPEWYFLFLFQLLKYFPGQLEWVGVVLLPLLAFVALVLLPFLDAGSERRLSKRPMASGVAVLLAGGIGFLTTAAMLTTPPAGVEEHGVRLTAMQVLGRTQYRQYCAGCHGASGEGTAEAPSLVGEGKRRDANYIHSYIEEPQRMSRTAIMPAFLGQLSHEDVEEVAQYVMSFSEGSK